MIWYQMKNLWRYNEILRENSRTVMVARNILWQVLRHKWNLSLFDGHELNIDMINAHKRCIYFTIFS